MIIAIPLLFAIVGLVMYLACANPKMVWVGQVLFATGIGAFLLLQGQAVVHLFGGKSV